MDRFTLFIGSVAALGALALASPTEAAAEVSASCAAHLASRPGETPAGDRRFHLARGEKSPCTAADAGSGAVAAAKSDGGRDRDGKSRFCRRNWFC